MLDILLKNAAVVDGTGRRTFMADIGIKDGLITRLFPIHPSRGTMGVGHENAMGLPITPDSEAPRVTADSTATHVIDVLGKVVCPGFIDVHAHDDLALLYDEGIQNKVSQGVTTTIIGNCGLGVAPVSEETREALRSYVEPVLGTWVDENDNFGYTTTAAFVEALENTKHALNVGMLVGHGPIRIRVMGFSDAVASDAEIRQMQELLHEGLSAGAVGMSLGLMYAPGCFADKRELLALASVVKQHGGIITSHIRGEGDLLLPSIQEMIDIAREVGVPMHISHLKAVGLRNWGTVQLALDRIEEARGEGLDVTCDVYPYSAGSTTVLSLLPPWALEGGVESVLSRLRDEVTRQQIAQDLSKPGTDWDNVAYLTGFDRVTLASTHSPQIKLFEGQTFAEIAQRLGCDHIEAYLRVLELGGGRDTIVVYHMDEADVRKVIRYAHSTIGSDGLPSPSGHPHPRLYGTFPRYLSNYVRDERLLPLEEAVCKITSFAATRFGIEKRGAIQEGYHADLVVIDVDKVSDTATYASPRQYAKGINYVIVNGQIVMESGTFTNQTPGRVLVANQN